jgi:hypothetical protein
MKGRAMTSRETSLLRTRLWQVNVEYSALLRDMSEEGRFVRMGELRTQRRALMTLLFGDTTAERRALASRQRRSEAAVLHGTSETARSPDLATTGA